MQYDHVIMAVKCIYLSVLLAFMCMSLAANDDSLKCGKNYAFSFHALRIRITHINMTLYGAGFNQQQSQPKYLTNVADI